MESRNSKAEGPSPHGWDYPKLRSNLLLNRARSYGDQDSFHLDELAEGVGFEPTRAFALPVFKTGAINHSTTPPVRQRSPELCHCRAREQGGSRCRSLDPKDHFACRPPDSPDLSTSIYVHVNLVRV